MKKAGDLYYHNDAVVFYGEADLAGRLHAAGWSGRADLYCGLFDRGFVLREKLLPRASVIVLAYKYHPDLERNFAALEHQIDASVELIYVMNGGGAVLTPDMEKLCDKIIITEYNSGECLRPRNLGTFFADGEIVIFLDDDAIPESNWVRAHLKAHADYECISVRGAAKSKINHRINESAGNYYLGDKPFPIFSDLEGNTSYKRGIFLSAGGFNDHLHYGGDGVDLSIRLLKIEPDMRKQIYSPEPVIYHDYCDESGQVEQKNENRRISKERLMQMHQNYNDYLKSWGRYRNKDYLLLSKKPEPEIKIENYQPFISIIVPCFNRGAYIAEAVQSALDQDYDNLEIVVVDDGSLDDTGRIVSQIGSSKIRYIRKEHTGAPDTRNRGIKEARGELILWLDSDDILLPGVIARYVDRISRYPDADVVYGNLETVDKDGAAIGEHLYQDFYGDTFPDKMIIGNCLPNPGTLIRKSIYDRFGGYDVEFRRAHDYEFWARVSPNIKARHCGQTVLKWRWHDGNISSGTVEKDTSYEARITRRLIERHTLQELFPQFDWDNETTARAKAFVELGNVFTKWHAYDDAHIYFNKCIESYGAASDETTRANACNGVGNIMLIKGDQGLAVEYFEKSIEVSETERAQFKLGVIYEQLDDIDKAAACFKRVLALNPTHGKAREYLNNFKIRSALAGF